MASNPQASGTLPPRPAVLGSAGPPQNFAPPMPMQFTPLVPPQTNQFVPSQQFRPVGQGMPGPNVAIPNGQTQMSHFLQSTLYLPPMSGQPGQVPPSSQAIPLPYFQASRPITSGLLPSQPNAQVPSNLPSFPNMGMHHSSSYTFVTSYGQAPKQCHCIITVSTCITDANSCPFCTTSLAWACQHYSCYAYCSDCTATFSCCCIAPQAQSLQPSSNDHNSSDWHEHTSPDGRRKEQKLLRSIKETLWNTEISLILVTSSSQWRKVQDRLEGDERCYRLEKIDRLEIFQEYVRDLEKEEEEKRKIQKEQIRRAEHKNRDEFRRLMEEHVASGVLTAKTQWRDYFAQVKDLAPYLAVASNSSGSTAKDLFEDVVEELEKQYHEDKSQIKDAVKIGKITLVSSWTFEQFKTAVAGIGSLKGIPEINLKLAFDELLERLQEKEEKEAKKRQRLADSFSDLLYSIKELTAYSNWEESKLLFLDSQEYWSLDDDHFARKLFEAYIAQLKEKLKEKDRKREEEKLKKEKEREERRKEKERERAKQKGKDRVRKDEAESDDADLVDDYGSKDRKRDKEKERKHRKHHHSHADEISSGKDEEDEHRKSKRQSSDRKKSRKHSHATDSDTENRHKRHRKDRDASRRNGSHEELEDGEVGEDGEIC